MQRKPIKIVNKLGLHARAAAKFVAHASRYHANIDVFLGEKKANGKSIMGVMMLAAKYGTEIIVETAGEDEVPALLALEELINKRFGETE